MQIHDLETPAAIVDLDRLAANITRFQTYLNRHGIANRPHIKTHKIPAIAQMQMAAGAAGITCQKLGEAEVMAAAGLTDIFVSYNIIGSAKLERLMALTRQAQVSVAADSAYTVLGLDAAARRAGVALTVLVEFDTGMQRCGVQSPLEAADLARLIAGSSALRFGGLMTYPNNAHTDPFVSETRRLLAADGIAVERVSGGGSKELWTVHTYRELTEHRAGMYVYGDRALVEGGVMSLAECAFTVITTVVSRPTADRGIIDGGSKTFSSDLLGLDGYGLILEYPEARIVRLSEEHGHVDFAACPRKPAIGERVTVLPNHCCVVSNLFNTVVGVRGGVVETTWPVAGRGAVQ